jgi:hypothetical protein
VKPLDNLGNEIRPQDKVYLNLHDEGLNGIAGTVVKITEPGKVIGENGKPINQAGSIAIGFFVFMPYSEAARVFRSVVRVIDPEQERELDRILGKQSEVTQ